MNLPALRRRHLLAFTLAACALAVACLNVVPGDSPIGATAQTALAGACTVALLALFDPFALKRRRTALAKAGRGPGALVTCAGVLAVALAAGIATAALLPASPGPLRPPAPDFSHLALFLVLCLATGVFEESLFRGILFRGFAESLDAARARRPLLVAAAASAAVFGVLHVLGDAAAPPADAVAAVQLVGKPVQAGLFGFVMADAYARSGSLWLVAGTHAAFNIMSEGPAFATSGLVVDTYVTGNPVDLIVLLATVALLVPFAAFAARRLARADGPA